MPTGILSRIHICVNTKFVDTTNNVKKEIDSNDLLDGIGVISKYILAQIKRKNKKNISGNNRKNMVTIIFESHGTTTDNEKHIASGWADAELSELGIKQAKELGERYKDEYFDAIFCSDLQRSYKTAEIAFGNRFPIKKDSRLKECDYGDFTQHSSEEVDKEKPKRIKKPFPNGESYEQISARMKDFIRDLIKNYWTKKVMIIGHRATQYGLDYWIKNIPISQSVINPWKWQPGWEYILFEKINKTS